MKSIIQSLCILLTGILIFNCNEIEQSNDSIIKNEDEIDLIDSSTKEYTDNNFYDPDSKFKIIKIDSNSNVYLIYASKHGNVFKRYYKIISNKSDSINDNWNRIELNNFYNLDLEIIASQKGVMEHVSEVSFGNGPSIKFEGDSITTLYNSRNMRGLYIKPDIETP